MQTSLLSGKSYLQNSLQFGRVKFAEAKKNHPKVAAAASRGLLASKLSQRVLKRLDQALHVLATALDPVADMLDAASNREESTLAAHLIVFPLTLVHITVAEGVGLFPLDL